MAIPMTKTGYSKLQDDVQELRNKIPEIQKHSPQQLDQKRNGLKLFKKLSLSESGISFKNEIMMDRNMQ